MKNNTTKSFREPQETDAATFFSLRNNSSTTEMNTDENETSDGENENEYDSRDGEDSYLIEKPRTNYLW